jgi:hypothetical protein
MLDGVAGNADHQCKQLLKDRCFRLAPVFPPGVSIASDDVKRVPEMVSFAEQVPLENTVAWLSTNWF